MATSVCQYVQVAGLGGSAYINFGQVTATPFVYFSR